MLSVCACAWRQFFDHKKNETNLFVPTTEVSDGDIDSFVVADACQYVSGGGCDGARWRGRRNHMRSVASEARTGFCSRAHDYPTVPWDSCAGQCVVVIKVRLATPPRHHQLVVRFSPILFRASPPPPQVHGDAHLGNGTRYFSAAHQTKAARARRKLKRLLAPTSTRVVVSEREGLAGRECSLNYSKATGDYHMGGMVRVQTCIYLLVSHIPSLSYASSYASSYACLSSRSSAQETADDSAAKERWEQKHCSTTASAAFREEQEEWFRWVNKTLTELDKPFLRMTFERFVADPAAAKTELQAFAGLSLSKLRSQLHRQGRHLEVKEAKSAGIADESENSF